jgi:hypothetical protein
VLLIAPALVLFGFSRRAHRLSGLPDRVGEDLGVVAGDTAAILRDAKGLRGLRSLLGSLRELGAQGDEVAAVAASVTGTLRTLNPVYLGVVFLAALGAGLAVGVALAALVVLLA